MKVVVDASVFLAFAIPEEEKHEEALQFFALCETGGHRVFFPALALAEVAGGVARRKRDSAKAALAVSRLLRINNVTVVAQTRKSAMAAAGLAGKCFLRGADAVYCQLAQETNAHLVTLDLEIQQRVPKGLTVFSPGDWAKSQQLD